MEAEDQPVDIEPGSPPAEDCGAEAWEGGIADVEDDVFDEVEELPLAHHEVVLEGMPAFDGFYDDFVDMDFDDEEEEDGMLWVDDDFSDNWEPLSDALSGGDFTDDSDISNMTSSTESDELEEPIFDGPNFVSPEDYSMFDVQTSSFHHQVADAVCCNGNQAPPGYQEIVKFHGSTIQILRIPDNKDEEIAVLFEEDIGARNEFRQYRVRPFSLARSDDGQYLAVASGDGFIFMMEIALGDRPATYGNKEGGSVGDYTDIIMYEKQKMFTFALTSIPQLANSVRFGCVGGKTRLVVGCQDNYILFFELPHESDRTPVVAALCSGQEELSLEPNEVDSKEVLCVAKDLSSISQTVTAAVGKFPRPINCVVSSRDGRWIATSGDFDYIMLLDEKKRYRLSKAKKLSFQPGTVLDTRSQGSQYCQFNFSGDVVVATSDHIYGAFAWSTDSGDLLFHVKARYPCLAISFLDNSVFAFHEAEKRVHIVDLRYFPQGHQSVRLPRLRSQSDQGQILPPRQITGLASGDNKLHVSTVAKLFVLEYIQGRKWSREAHRLHPAAFKSSMRSLILGAASDPNSKVHSLPQDTIEQIISCAAHPIGEWLPSSGVKV